MKKVASFLKKYINGTKGAISLFLAILMVPFVTIAGALINASRLNSAVAVFDEALCNASNSTLGTYDEFLRKRFALLAISQDSQDAAQQLGISPVEYTTEDFVNELFVYYMQQNLSSLGNTYDSASANATGLYPLSDINVLESSVLQSSKITVPAKMMADWGALEDMLALLTEPFDLLSQLGDLASSGMTVATDIDALKTKKTALETKIGECNTAKTNYENAYKEFKKAVDQWNTLLTNISNAKEYVKTCQTILDEMNEKVSDINEKIATKEAKIKDLQERKPDNYASDIAKLQDEIEELKVEREEKAPGYDQAVINLANAKKSLSNYEGQVETKRKNVETKRKAYYGKIVKLQEEINATSKKAVEFQKAGEKLLTDGASLVGEAVSTGVALGEASNEKNQKQVKEERQEYKNKYDDAVTSNQPGYADYFDDRVKEKDKELQDLKDDKVDLKNAGKTTESAINTMKNTSKGLADFADRDLKGEYQAIFDKLEECRVYVNGLSAPVERNRYSYDASKAYTTFTNPLTPKNLQDIIDNLESQMVNNAGWTLLTTVIGFFDALFDIKFKYDSNLNATINEAHYSANGGLPSKIDRDVHPISNPYEAEDAAQALAYKKELNSYSKDDVYKINGGGMTDAEKITAYIDEIKGYISDFSIWVLDDLLIAVGNLIGTLIKMGASMAGKTAENLVVGLRDRILLTGYISYNTANRTTYSGSGLTGEGFDLPKKDQHGGYTFCGAETEYIFAGTMSEKTNQEKAFDAIWVERLIFDLACVLGNPMVQSLATSLGAITFGIGTVVTYVVFLAAEAAIDAIILVNGGDIEILKATMYLSPTGIGKLLGKISVLKLNDAAKRSLYNTCTSKTKTITEGSDKLAKSENPDFKGKPVKYDDYDTFKSNQDAMDEEYKIADLFTMDYTKSLQLWMLIFSNRQTTLKRLANLIQMEATYQVKLGDSDLIHGDFNLDKSYTYIRASGDFSSTTFIRISEEDSYTSKYRVIYNGY